MPHSYFLCLPAPHCTHQSCSAPISNSSLLYIQLDLNCPNFEDTIYLMKKKVSPSTVGCNLREENNTIQNLFVFVCGNGDKFLQIIGLELFLLSHLPFSLIGKIIYIWFSSATGKLTLKKWNLRILEGFRC